MIGEPSPTQADLHFEVFGIPVRVHPFFWVVIAILGLSGTRGEPLPLLIWVLVAFVSILIHELGHALTARYFGHAPWITLYSFGGLASYRPTRHDTRSRVIISAAGPIAGFMFLALVMSIVHASGHWVTLFPNGVMMPWFRYEAFPNEHLNTMVAYLYFINLFWGLVNLLPVYPLDGGQIARELFVRYDTYNGVRNSLYVSIVAAVVMGVYGAFQMRSLFVAILFGLMAYNNYMVLQQMSGRGGPFGGSGGGYGGRGW